MEHFDTTKTRPNEPPMPDPLAYFLTWTTYGTWLPGDERGWVLRGQGFQLPDLQRKARARERMAEEACTLIDEQRRVVEKTIAEHCRIRGWELHVVNCRTNHVHVVVTAPLEPEDVRDQFKAWCTRKLKELQRGSRSAGESGVGHPLRKKWWSEGGSQRYNR